MDTTVLMKSSSWSLLAVVGICCVFAAAEGFAADVEVGIQVGVSHTDNVFLGTSPNEEDDFIYRASPWLTIVHESPGLDANLRYRFDWYSYDTLSTTTSYHMGEGSLTGKLWEESLAVELGATRRQVFRDPNGTIPPGRLAQTGNLADRDEIYINPRLERKLGSAVGLNAEYRYSDGSYDDPLVQEDTNHHGSASLQNYDAGKGMSWALRYDYRKTEYEVSREWEYQQASAELGFWVNEKLRLFGAGGKESPWDDPFNPDMEDTYWEAGFAYEAGESLSAEFAGGERSFGSSWRGRLDYTFRRGNTSLSYAESPTTTGFNRSSGRRSFLDADDQDEFLDTPGQAERYLSKRLQWDLSFDLRRSGLAIALFDEDRSGRIQADGTPLEDQAQRGIRAGMTWNAGSRTSFEASASILRRDSGVDSRSDFYRVGLDIGYTLGSQSQLSFVYDYAEQQPKNASSTGRDYVNNVFSLFFTYTM